MYRQSTRPQATGVRERPPSAVSEARRLAARNAALERALSERDAARRILEERLRRAERLGGVGLAAAGVAHDLNNLLAGILTSASLALETLPAGSGAAELTAHVRLAATRAVELVRRMMATARGGDTARERRTAVDVSELARETVALLRPVLDPAAHVELALDPSAPRVVGDPTALRQVVMNLVKNASDALLGRPGTIAVETQQVVVATTVPAPDLDVDGPVPVGRWTVLRVRDTGCGMDAHTLQRVFDPFFTTKFTGRGLGMSTVLGIVRAHGGAIFVDSAPGAGSRVRVLFPVPNRPAAQPAPASAPASPSPSPSLSVLVADDEDFLLKLYSKALSALGLNVLTASDGLQALNIFRQKPREIAAVILDLTMPNMDGAAALKELRRIQPDVPVILTSGYSQDEAARRVNASDVTCFLQKPCALDRLKEAVRKAIGATPPPTSPGRPG